MEWSKQSPSLAASFWETISIIQAGDRYGLTYEAVVIERHLARAFSGNSSPVTTHATGPQEEAKKKMYMHTNFKNKLAFTFISSCLFVSIRTAMAAC